MKKTVREYAIHHGISVTAVWKRIKRGAVISRKINGITYVWDGDTIPDDDAGTNFLSVSASQIADHLEKKQIEIQTLRAKLANLRADTIIKKEKIELIKEKYRQQFANDIAQMFTVSFADVKAYMIKLKLNRQQRDIFQREIKKTLDVFRIKLTQYLSDLDNDID